MLVKHMRTNAPIRVKIGPDVTVIIQRIGETAKLAVDAPRNLHIDVTMATDVVGGLNVYPEALPGPSRKKP
jgi:hypothetical protein